MNASNWRYRKVAARTQGPAAPAHSAYTLAWGAVLIALLVVDATAGNSTASAVRFTAPFAGFAFDSSLDLGRGCGMTSNWTTPPSFNLSTGDTRATGSFTARTCPSIPNSHNGLDAIGQVGFWGANFTGTGSTQHIRVSWVLGFLENFTLGNISGGTGVLGGNVNLSLLASVTFPPLGGSHILWQTKNWVNFHYITGSLSVKVKHLPVQLFVNGTLTKGQTYSVQTFVLVEINLSSRGTGHGKLFGRVVIGGPGNPCQLVSIRVA